MRHAIFIATLLWSSTLLADVYTCQTRDGETVYSDLPCAKGALIEKISPSESEPDVAAAQRELQRQKAYTERLSAENAKARGRSSGIAILPDNSNSAPKSRPPKPLSPSSSVQSSTPPSAR